MYRASEVCEQSCITSIYLLKVNNRNTRTRCEICSKLTIKTPERCHWQKSLLTSFSLVTSTNLGISPQNIPTFSFNLFATLF